jgi:CheY-like chemotaxis protein
MCGRSSKRLARSAVLHLVLHGPIIRRVQKEEIRARPRAMSEPEPTIERRPAPVHHASPTGARPSRTDCVTLVDDDASLLPILQQAVADAFGGGLGTRYAATALAGLADLRERRPRMVVLDLNLPDLDGVTVLRAIRADARLRRVPVLMLTADSRWATLQVAMDAGADGYLFKPFDYATLVSTLRDLSRLRPSDGGL